MEPDFERTHHRLNCAKLMRQRLKGEPNPCSCGAEIRDGEHENQHGRPAAGIGPVHNHGPDEDPGLACPEHWVAGKLTGECVSGKYPGYSMLDEHHGEPSVGSPVDSRPWPGLSDEVRTVSSTGGQKGVKEARFDLIPPEALQKLAEHYGVGAIKYGEHNWRKGFEWSKSFAAMQRHAHAFWAGEDLDPETGKPHMSAVAFHALTLLVFMDEQPDFDDRFKGGTK